LFKLFSSNESLCGGKVQTFLKHKIEMDERNLARNSARNFSFMVAAASILNFIRWSNVDSSLAFMWLASFGVTLSLGIVTSLKKSYLTGLSSLFFWTSFLISCYITAVTNIHLALDPKVLSPFAGFKLAALVIAVLAPVPVLNGYLAIIICGFLPVGLYYTVMSHAQSVISVQEPGLTFVTATISLMVLAYRNRSLQVERSYAKLMAEKENLRELSHVFLALRDMTNTPLQIITLTADLLETQKISPEKAAKHLKSAVGKLNHVAEILAEYQSGETSELNENSMYDSSDPATSFKDRLQFLKSKSK
jgi:hypothetical protein